MKNQINLIFRSNMNEKLKELKEDNPKLKIWSISRLNNFNNCKRAYFYTYVEEDKKEQKPGVYSIIGSSAHDDLENLYEGKTEKLERKCFDEEWLKCQMFGINFMSDNVRDNYKKDLDVHYNIYQKPDGEFISELGFILKISEDDILIGYIDLIQLLGDNKVKIVDFKTSSKFDKKKIFESGRQLTVYQLALEQLYQMDVVDNGWEMLKYVTVKVGDYKAKDVSAREWVSKCKTNIKNLNKKKKYIDEAILDMLLSKCEMNNDISSLPQEIQDEISITTCYIPYDVTDEVKEETINYISNTIKAIGELDENDIEAWECEVNDFYCNTLCGFSGKYCRYWENRKIDIDKD